MPYKPTFVQRNCSSAVWRRLSRDGLWAPRWHAAVRKFPRHATDHWRCTSWREKSSMDHKTEAKVWLPDKLSPWNSRDWASAFHSFTHSSKLYKWRPIILFLEENVDHIPKAVAKEPNLWCLVSLCDACSCAACNVLGFPDPWSVDVVAKSNL